MSRLGSRARRAWLRLHRLLGLGLGAAFVLLGLSGSLLVFYVEIDRMVEPTLRLPALKQRNSTLFPTPLPVRRLRRRSRGGGGGGGVREARGGVPGGMGVLPPHGGG